MNRNSLKLHLIEGSVTYDFTLHLRAETTLHDFGGVLGRPLGTFFGLSQSNGQSSWLVCEVALKSIL